MEQQQIKIAVLGGSGRTGQYLVKHLLNHGFPLKVMVRHPENFTIENPLLEVVKGDALNYDSINSLLIGCEAVISTIGTRKGEPLVAFASTENLIKAMTLHDINRYIAVTGLTINTPSDEKSIGIKIKSFLMRLFFPNTIADKQKAYELLADSDLDWTLVRVPLIEYTGTRTFIKVSLLDCPGKKISSTDIAFFLGDQLTDTKYIQEAPFIANR